MYVNYLRLAVAALIAGVLVSTTASAAEPGSSAPGFRFRPVTEQSLGLFEGEKPIFVYNHGRISRAEIPGARPRACYFHPIYGLDGEALTDDFPKDHLYHRGMYFAWPHIKIGDKEYELWTSRGELQQKFRQWLGKVANAKGARLGIENGWMIGDKLAVREQIWVTVHSAKSDSRAIDVQATWTPIDEPLTLSGAEGKSYGGFNFRFGPRTKTTITVPTDTMLPADVTATAGRVSGDLLVTKLPWADFVGDFSEAKGLSGAAIFVHPGHRDYPPTWMTRHYGLVSVGWPGVEPQTFPANQPITCQYRVWIHRGSPSATEIQKAYDTYRGESK
jgi:hypothetical protein